MVDALDEAQHPPTLLTEVLAQLNPPDQPGRVRLIVGVRSPGGVDDPTSAGTGRSGRWPTWPNNCSARPGCASTSRPGGTRRTSADYAAELLTATPGSPYAGAGRTTQHARTVAEALADAGRASRS